MAMAIETSSLASGDEQVSVGDPTPDTIEPEKERPRCNFAFMSAGPDTAGPVLWDSLVEEFVIVDAARKGLRTAHARKDGPFQCQVHDITEDIDDTHLAEVLADLDILFVVVGAREDRPCGRVRVAIQRVKRYAPKKQVKIIVSVGNAADGDSQEDLALYAAAHDYRFVAFNVSPEKDRRSMDGIDQVVQNIKEHTVMLESGPATVVVVGPSLKRVKEYVRAMRPRGAEEDGPVVVGDVWVSWKVELLHYVMSGKEKDAEHNEKFNDRRPEVDAVVVVRAADATGPVHEDPVVRGAVDRFKPQGRAGVQFSVVERASRERTQASIDIALTTVNTPEAATTLVVLAESDLVVPARMVGHLSESSSLCVRRGIPEDTLEGRTATRQRRERGSTGFVARCSDECLAESGGLAAAHDMRFDVDRVIINLTGAGVVVDGADVMRGLGRTAPDMVPQAGVLVSGRMGSPSVGLYFEEVAPLSGSVIARRVALKRPGVSPKDVRVWWQGKPVSNMEQKLCTAVEAKAVDFAYCVIPLFQKQECVDVVGVEQRFHGVIAKVDVDTQRVQVKPLDEHGYTGDSKWVPIAEVAPIGTINTFNWDMWLTTHGRREASPAPRERWWRVEKHTHLAGAHTPTTVKNTLLVEEALAAAHRNRPSSPIVFGYQVNDTTRDHLESLASEYADILIGVLDQPNDILNLDSLKHIDAVVQLINDADSPKGGSLGGVVMCMAPPTDAAVNAWRVVAVVHGLDPYAVRDAVYKFHYACFAGAL